MVKRSSSPWFTPFSFFLPRGGDSLCYFLALISLLSLLFHHLSGSSSAVASADLEGFDTDDAFAEGDEDDLTQVPLRSSPLPTLTHSDPENLHDPPSTPDPAISHTPPSPLLSDSILKPSAAAFDFWDEDEFEGLPVQPSRESPESTDDAAPANPDSPSQPDSKTRFAKEIDKRPRSYMVEILCVSFLVMFAINYFIGKKENENLALAWAAKFATRDSIFEKNFSFLGVGKEEDSPLLLKEGQNVFKFYASGRRYCQGLLATMELQSRHDLISRMYNMLVPCRDEISFEVYMNDDAMDHVVFAVARKKAAKGMQKELSDLQRFAGLISPPSNRKWITDELSVISESKEVAGDLITEAVLNQVLGDKAFEKFGKGFISMHFSDQHAGMHKKMLLFKFALPDAKNMAELTQLVTLVPYYIDLIGRYKLSSQARSKTETGRQKAAQEAYRKLQNARQEAVQKRMAERKKMSDEAEAKLGSEALRKKEARDRARQTRKTMPRMKMTSAH